MVLRGALLMPQPDGDVLLRGGAVTIEDQRIASVAIDADFDPASLGPGRIIAPAFTDPHLHLPQFDAIGIAGLPLLEWLDRVVFPAEARWEDASYAESMTDRVARQLARVGTVGVGAYATVHHAATMAAINQLGSDGFRGVVGQVLMDQGAPDELIRPTAQLLDEAAELSSRARIRPAVTPRFVPTCSHALLKGAGDLAADTGWTVQTHLAETRAECDLVAAAYPDQTYTQVYQSAGLLQPGALLAHAIWLADDDRASLAEHNCIACHCPTSNTFLTSGDMDYRATAEHNVKIALASDVAAGPDRCMVGVARAALDLARRLHTDQPPLTPKRAWWHITRGNAAAMGWDDAGALEPGHYADLIIVEPDIPWHTSSDPLATLIYAWDDRWLRATIAAGRIIHDAANDRNPTPLAD